MNKADKKMKKKKKLLFYTSTTFAVICLFLTIFFFFKHYQTVVLVDALEKDALKFRPNLTIEEKALLISQRIFAETDHFVERENLDWYSEWEATSFFNMTTSVGLEYNCFGIRGEPGDGPCGTMTKIFLVAMWDLDIHARKLQLEPINSRGGHTMAEFYYKGKWRVISPSDSSFVWRTKDGEIATVEEIRNDTSIFNQIYKNNPKWPYGFNKTSNINWEKLPSFMVPIIKFLIGKEGFENSETPAIYETPRKLLLIFFLVFTIIFSLLSIYSYRKINRVNPELKSS
jgi:cell division protein FtsL